MYMEKTNISIQNKKAVNAGKIKQVFLFLIFFIIIQDQTFSQPIAQGKDKFFGAGTSSDIYRYFDDYWTQISPGNDGKWGSVESVQGNFNWTNLDKIYNYAKNRDILFKEHTLIWGSQQPGWMSSLDSVGQRAAIENWFSSIGARYPLMAMADVVNEPLHSQPIYKDALGGDGETGWDWVITAFELAREYLPDSTKLILNDYNILHDNTVTDNYLAIINLLKDRGLIDGIGIQGHYFEFRSDLSSSTQYVYTPGALRTNLNKLTDTGIPVYITEFDIDEPVDSNQLEQYKIYFPIFWRNPGVVGITFWGYVYGDVWSTHPDTYLIRSNNSERPALEWLRSYVNTSAPPVLISPVKQSGVPQNPALIWNPSDSAISYHIQVSSNISFTSISIDTTIADTSLQLPVLGSGKRAYWRVSSINIHGESEFTDGAYFQTGSEIVSVDNTDELPDNFSLSQNYPNPFNPNTIIEYSLPAAVSGSNLPVQLKIYDLLGQEVATLVKKQQSAGNYKVEFDGSKLASGIYLYSLHAGEFSKTKKMILLK